MKNIVLVTIDCLRYDRCGFNGYHRNTTPNLDSLTDSYFFDNAYSTGPYTTESFPGILAGQHSHNGAQYGDHPAWKALPKDSTTVASLLSEQGYQTSAIISNPHLSCERNFDIGFDTYQNLRAESDSRHSDEDDSRFNIAEVEYQVRERMRNTETIYNPYSLAYVLYRYKQYQSSWPTTRAETITSLAIDEIDDQECSSPFFLWTHYMDLHAPIHPNSASELDDIGTIKSLFYDAGRASRNRVPYDRLYDGALRYVDSNLGNLINNLKNNNVWEETMLIVTGDHGEALYDRQGVYGHPRHYHYDELLHVPLLINIPDETGQRISSSISLAWLHELISDAINIDRGDFPSKSGSRNLFQEPASEPIVSDTLDEEGHTVSVRDKHIKHVVNKLDDSGDIEWDYADSRRSYLYNKDQAERNPIEIDSHLFELAESLITLPPTLPQVDGDFDNDIENRLRDLGYKM
ncbi:sulfatase [Natrinema thermotolerans]